MSTKPTCVLYHFTLPLYLFPILFYQSVLPNELPLTLTLTLTLGYAEASGASDGQGGAIKT